MAGQTILSIPGPTNMPAVIRAAIDVPLEDHRAPDFPGLTLRLFDDLKRVFRTSRGRIFVFTGSGTSGWEAAVTNTLSPGDKVLIARYGHFTHLWADLCRRHGLDVEIIDVEWGEALPVEIFANRLARDPDRRIKAVLVCHNETATGVTSDVAGVRDALDASSHPALLMVDGVSSIGCIDFRMAEWGVDVAVAGSQKGFMMPTGLAIVGVSDKALAAGRTAACTRGFFDFADMAKSNDDGYYPYTPATTLLHGLRASVDRLLHEGLENVHTRHHRLAEGTRRAVAAWDLRLCARDPHTYSDTVSAICVPDGFDAGDVVKLAYYRYKLSLGAGLSKVAGKVFRIGHLGDLNDLMVLTAIAGGEMAMRDLGIPIDLGSGVAAAQEYFRRTARPVDLNRDLAATM